MVDLSRNWLIGSSTFCSGSKKRIPMINSLERVFTEVNLIVLNQGISHLVAIVLPQKLCTKASEPFCLTKVASNYPFLWM